MEKLFGGREGGWKRRITSWKRKIFSLFGRKKFD